MRAANYKLARSGEKRNMYTSKPVSEPVHDQPMDESTRSLPDFQLTIPLATNEEQFPQVGQVNDPLRIGF